MHVPHQQQRVAERHQPAGQRVVPRRRAEQHAEQVSVVRDPRAEGAEGRDPLAGQGERRDVDGLHRDRADHAGRRDLRGHGAPQDRRQQPQIGRLGQQAECVRQAERLRRRISHASVLLLPLGAIARLATTSSSSSSD